MVLVFGCLVAVLHINKSHEHKAVVVIAIALIVLFIWGVLVYFNENSFIRGRHQFVFGIAFSFILLLLLNNKYLMRGITHSWLVKKIAGQAVFSYTLYLIHFPLLLLIWVATSRYVQGNFLLVFVLSSVSVVLVMWVSAKASGLTERDAKRKVQQRYYPPILRGSFSDSGNSNSVDAKQ